MKHISQFCRRNPTIVIGAVLLVLVTALALAAPLIAGDPVALMPIDRLLPPSMAHWLGTDFLGRDIYARVVYGARVSLIVGLSVAAMSIVIGLTIGLAAGYWRGVDAVVMRFMDGLMGNPRHSARHRHGLAESCQRVDRHRRHHHSRSAAHRAFGAFGGADRAHATLYRSGGIRRFAGAERSWCAISCPPPLRR